MTLVALAFLSASTALAARGDSTIQQLDAEVRAARQRIAMLEERARTCAEDGGPGDIYPQLVQIFAGTEVTVARSGPRVVVTIPGDLLFGEGMATIRREAAMVLDLLGTALTLHPDRVAWVIGHTDARPLSSRAASTFSDSRGLSLAMADGLVDALMAQHDLPSARFTVAGRGADAPLVPEDTPAGQARNRRVVVVIGPPDPFR
jgi:type VI secretion system protein ImpK